MDCTKIKPRLAYFTKMEVCSGESKVKEHSYSISVKIVLIFLTFVIIGQTVVLIVHEKRLNSVEGREILTWIGEDESKWASLAYELKVLNEAVKAGQSFHNSVFEFMVINY